MQGTYVYTYICTMYMDESLIEPIYQLYYVECIDLQQASLRRSVVLEFMDVTVRLSQGSLIYVQAQCDYKAYSHA